MKKKVIGGAIFLFALLGLDPASTPQAKAVKASIALVVDGVTIKTDVAPEVKDGRAMVPLRVLATSMGVTVSWASNEVRLTQGQTTVLLYPGQKYATKNSTSLTLDVSPYAKDGRILIPLRLAAEVLGCTVDYFQGIVSVKTPPFAIDDQVVAFIQFNTYLESGIITSELHGNRHLERFHKLLEAGKGDIADTPSELELSHFKVAERYAFVDQSGTNLRRYTHYFFHSQSDIELLYEEPSNTWHTFRSEFREKLEGLFNEAAEAGLWINIKTEQLGG